MRIPVSVVPVSRQPGKVRQYMATKETTVDTTEQPDWWHPQLDPYSADYPDYAQDTKLVSPHPVPSVQHHQGTSGSSSHPPKTKTFIRFDPAKRLPYPWKAFSIEKGAALSTSWLGHTPATHESIKPDPSVLVPVDVSSTEHAANLTFPDPDSPPSLSLILTPVQEQLDDLKSVLFSSATYPAACVERAKSKANPLSAIGSNIFCHSDAVLLAVLDRHPLHLFYHHHHHHDRASGNKAPMRKREQVTFVDLCGGPGGFAEYILWQGHHRKVKTYGYGLTPNVNAVHTHPKLYTQDVWERSVLRGNFFPYRHGSGEPWNAETRRGFLQWMPKKPIDLILGTALPLSNIAKKKGSDATEISSSNMDDEKRSFASLLSIVAVMLRTLSKEGTFILKLKGSLTHLTADVLYLLYLAFDVIGLHKSLLCTPCDSDRILLCQGFKQNVPHELIKYLERICDQLLDPEMGVVPVRLFNPETGFMQDAAFVESLQRFNLHSAMRQIQHLREVQSWIHDPFGVEYDRAMLAKSCLTGWNLPHHLHLS